MNPWESYSVSQNQSLFTTNPPPQLSTIPLHHPAVNMLTGPSTPPQNHHLFPSNDPMPIFDLEWDLGDSCIFDVPPEWDLSDSCLLDVPPELLGYGAPTHYGKDEDLLLEVRDELLHHPAAVTGPSTPPQNHSEEPSNLVPEEPPHSNTSDFAASCLSDVPPEEPKLPADGAPKDEELDQWLEIIDELLPEGLEFCRLFSDENNNEVALPIKYSQPSSTVEVAPRGQKRQRNAWSAEEHELFLMGLKKFGHGDWKSISTHFVKTRSNIQIASHAQKYYLRLNESDAAARKKTRSMHDVPI